MFMPPSLEAMTTFCDARSVTGTYSFLMSAPSSISRRRASAFRAGLVGDELHAICADGFFTSSMERQQTAALAAHRMNLGLDHPAPGHRLGGFHRLLDGECRDGAQHLKLRKISLMLWIFSRVS
jgi:hypothetical protein